MANSTRILALVAIAAFGLLALKSLSLSQNVFGILDPATPAFAAAAPAKEKKKKAEQGKGKTAGRAPALVSADADKDVAQTPPPKCEGPTPAEQAGLSQEELNVYLTLGERNRLLDKRESEIATREGLIAVSQQQLDARINTIERLKTDIANLLGQVSEQEEAQTLALTKLYETMKPKSAAPIFANLDEDVLLTVASRMKAGNLANVMAAMPPEKAGELTIALASRHRLPEHTKDLPGFSAEQK